MDTKQILAIVAVIAIAAAGIGAAYAYQAELTDEANTVESNYLELNNAGQFTGHFSNADLQWDMVNSQKDKGYYTPAGTLAPVAGDLMGIKLIETTAQLTDLVISINSSSLPAGDWFKFNVEPVQAANHSKQVDLNASYALKFTYQKSDAVAELSTPAEVYIDYIILDGTTDAQGEVTNAKQTLFYSDKIAAYGAQTVTIEMYAIPTAEVDNPNTGLDFTLVDFVFTAEAISNPSTTTITVTPQEMDATTAATPVVASVALREASADNHGARIANTASAAYAVVAIQGLSYQAGTADYMNADQKVSVKDTWNCTATGAISSDTGNVTMSQQLTKLTITADSAATTAQTAMKFSKADNTAAGILTYIKTAKTSEAEGAKNIFGFSIWSGNTETAIDASTETKLSMKCYDMSGTEVTFDDSTGTTSTHFKELPRGAYELRFTYTAAENIDEDASLLIYLAD